MYYLSTSTVVRAFDELAKSDFNNESILHIFFILKACGFNDLAPKPVALVKELGYEPSYILGSLFGRDEKEPEKYTFINPFKLSTWNSQPTEALKKWVTLRSINNITGGARSWRKLVDYDADEETLKFTFNYLENLKELTFQDTKIDLQAFSVWVARFSAFDNRIASKHEIIESCRAYFNLSDREMIELFENISNIQVDFSESEFDKLAIRSKIVPDNGGPEWLTPPKLSSPVNLIRSIYMQNESAFDKSITVDKILHTLAKFNNVMLSGPPATSKSYLAKKVSEHYDIVESVQFHPEYNYQDFIGGYFVEGESVNFQKGLLTAFAEEAMQNPDQSFLLIIDEVNRGNLSSILGEAIQGLDRGYVTQIKIGTHGFDLQLPVNLHILATRNTTDKSLSNIDLAVYRRFIDFKVAPDINALADLVEIEGGISARDLLNKINKKLFTVTNDRDLQIGHAVFLKDSMLTESGKYYWSQQDFEILLRYGLIPLATEYCQGREDKLDQVFGSQLLEHIGGDQFIQSINDFIMLD